MKPVDEAIAVAGWRAGGGTYWIALSGGRPDDLAAWPAMAGLDPDLFDPLQIGNDQTLILPLADSVYIAFPIPKGDDARKPAHFRFLCLDRLVITIDEGSARSSASEEGIAKFKIQEGTTAGVVCALAVIHSARLRNHIIGLRREGDVLSDIMDSDPEALSLAEILALKRRVLAFGALLDEELAVLGVLKVINLPALSLVRLAGPFQVAIETTQATERDIDRLDRRIGDLMDGYKSAQQDKTNRRLGLLTIISAIFMPLTLIAGIYGMNFDVMPELHYRYSYPIALGIMALIAGGLFWYFISRKWLK
jgi:Mg2+ and Co2+ transporter CorA